MESSGNALLCEILNLMGRILVTHYFISGSETRSYIHPPGIPRTFLVSGFHVDNSLYISISQYPRGSKWWSSSTRASTG
jgi:hypothetical protein